jgi:DNA repair protein RecN (Recombination protein N)
VLRELRIENLLLIERAELRLEEGLNSITGETGAGKTILAHSLDLLMGGRARAHVVRPGAGEAWVEGVFDLPPDLLEDPALADVAERLPAGAEDIVLGRRVGSSGRTAAFVGGRSASAADLGRLGERLLAFYGQHEHRRLTIASAQLAILDGFAGEGHLEEVGAYRAAHREHARLAAAVAELHDREGNRERDLDLLRWELSEIEEAAPEPGEDERLRAERERLRHLEELRLAGATAATAVSGDGGGEAGAEAALAGAAAALAARSGVDPELDRLAERFDAIQLELQDAGGELRAYLESLESDPARLRQLEERLDVLDRLARKHGGSVESVLAHAERCRAEIARLDGAGERGAELEAALAETAERRRCLAEGLSAGRRAAARELEERIGAELSELAMPGARLEVALDPHPDGLGALGAETVEMRVATNPGMKPAPLRDAASGGELSRVMLALSGLGAGAGAETLVFDEIDAGIGGNTARVVGGRLASLAEGRQVLCITHLPQVASFAQAHFRIEKRIEGEDARAIVERIDGEELVAEITRMLGAERGDETASRHARELLAAA